MKLLQCLDCKQIVSLGSINRSCPCGKSWGRYLRNNFTALITTRARVLGIFNHEMEASYPPVPEPKDKTQVLPESKDKTQALPASKDKTQALPESKDKIQVLSESKAPDFIEPELGASLLQPLVFYRWFVIPIEPLRVIQLSMSQFATYQDKSEPITQEQFKTFSFPHSVPCFT